MADIIRGTTPTITYTFKTVNVQNITVAILTIKYNGSVVIQKDLSNATVATSSLSWLLSQEETLSFDANQKAKMMINYKLADGTRGASNETELHFKTNHITEVI